MSNPLIPAEGEVYCLYHGCVHDETTDPYNYGYAESGERPECLPEDWRRLYWRARKGDEEDRR